MGWFDNIKSRRVQRREAAVSVPGVPATTDPKAASNNPVVAGSGSFEERIVRVNNPQMSLTISAVYRAVELKAKTLGSMEMQYQRKDTIGGNFVEDLGFIDRGRTRPS